MSKAVRTILCLVVSLVLFGTMALAQNGGSNASKDKSKKNKEHHSRLAKVEFWRHHKDNAKNAKPVKQAESKQAQPKPAQVKRASAKQVAAEKDQKPVRRASKVSKAPAKKAVVRASAKSNAKSNAKSKPAAKKQAAVARTSVKRHHTASKAKAQKKSQDHTTAS